MTDQELIRDYAENRAETAFSALVEKYADLVYSSCFRQLQNTHLAEEASQAVFMILAEKAEQLTEYTSIAGWLVNTARYASMNALKYEKRRKNREREASDMRVTNEKEQQDWNELSAHLDEALFSLDEKDRDVIVLRYFQDKPHKEVAHETGLSEAAAQKRGSRALEKLKTVMEKKGIILPVTVLSGLLVQNAVQAAPSGLAALCTAAGSGSAAAAGGSIYSIYKGAIFMIVWTKAKIAALVAAVSIVFGMLTGIVSGQHAEAEIGRIEQKVEEKQTEIEKKDEDLDQLRKKVAILEQRNSEVSQDIDTLLSQLDEADRKLTERENDLKRTLNVWAVQQDIADQKIAALEKKAEKGKQPPVHPLLQMMKDPAMRKMTLEMNKKGWRKDYAAFFNRRKMTDAEINAFINEMARYESEGNEVLIPIALNPNRTEEDWKSAHLIKENLELKHIENMKNLLGEEGYREMSDFDEKRKAEQKQKWLEDDVSEYKGYLIGEGEKLNKEQEHKLLELFREKSEISAVEENFTIFFPDAGRMEEMYRKKEEGNQMVLNKAQGFLTEQQVFKLQKYLEDELSSEKNLMEMTRSMMSTSVGNSETSE